MRSSIEPFYPCQTTSGETYVVDGRTGKVAATVSTSFDMAERWAVAKRKAKRMNDEHFNRVMAGRRLRAFLGLILVLSLLAFELLTGDLSAALR